eukprot:CAMPEP_0202773706 /NCGR_PEP_ID=MMETSP1388-20130828/45097_1 /ASSEMBLY_ACC=CAM_ASM_000864 /TAXON_ID=37098 /ORGANISM="Isochrysis sp, Strain CCMP1244" /LENGTH=70 /DNA_ID=CAMNT_0049442733 /DNA_START=12 /DNA_END=220 /DNA_ORIENTATION=-
MSRDAPRCAEMSRDHSTSQGVQAAAHLLEAGLAPRASRLETTTPLPPPAMVRPPLPASAGAAPVPALWPG